VWFVDLAPVRAEVVVETIAAALGAAEQPDRPLEAAITALVGVHRSLLLLDNCDHLLEPVSTLAQRLLAACPGTVILATSRERLGVIGEQVFTVQPMPVSGSSAADGEGSDAESLFLERARSVDPTLTADHRLVTAVCTRCDGLPLAIELAAGRCASMGVDGLLAGLDDHLRLLVGEHALTQRHRSVRAVLDWSHDYLSEDEQALFRQLGMFTSSFDATAATAVSAGLPLAAVIDLIGRLTDKNLLVHVTAPTGSRWRMLDIVRSYARERLAGSDDEPVVRRRYLSWMSAAAAELEQRLTTGRPWRDEFAVVTDDLHAALGVSSETWPVDRDRLVLALALARLHARLGAFTLAQSAYEDAVAIARKTGDAAQLARAALGASEPGMLFGVMQTKRVALLEEALVALESEVSGTRVRVQARLATELYWSRDQARSRELADEAMTSATRLGDVGALAHALYASHYVTRGPGMSKYRLMLAERINRAARQSGETRLELAALAAHAVGVLESGDLAAMNADIDALAAEAERLDHPEFQWYVAVYRLVQALVTGRFSDADALAAQATAAAKYAPEFSVGLYFAEAITDLRERDRTSLRRHAAQLAEMAGRFPRIVVWRCLALLNDITRDMATDARRENRELTDELLAQDVRDGHWLVACCLAAEAAAELGDRRVAELLSEALDPFVTNVAVAGRVAAFRGSVAYPLGLLADVLGDRDRAVRYLSMSAKHHERIGARPFLERSRAALAAR
jgi:predicted ATPase